MKAFIVFNLIMIIITLSLLTAAQGVLTIKRALHNKVSIY